MAACTLHAGYIKLQTHTKNIKYLIFSTARMVEGTRLTVTVYPTCLYNYFFQTLHVSIESDHHQAFFTES